MMVKHYENTTVVLSTDPRDRGCCSVNLVKGIFIIFNSVFLISGILILGVGLWTYYSQYLHLILMRTITLELIIWLMVATGGCVILGSILGCVAVRWENKCIISMVYINSGNFFGYFTNLSPSQYLFLLMLVFMAEVMIGLLSYVYHEQVGQDLKLNLREVFLQSYSVQEDQTKVIDILQQRYSCCGALSFEDWQYSNWLTSHSKRNKVPESCCKTVHDHCGISNHPSNIPYTGCIHPLEFHIQSHLSITGSVGLSCSLIQIVGLIYATCLLGKLVTLHRYLKLEHDSALRKKIPPMNNNTSKSEFQTITFTSDTNKPGKTLEASKGYKKMQQETPI